MFRVYRVVREDLDKLSDLLQRHGIEEVTRRDGGEGTYVIITKGDVVLSTAQLQIKDIRARTIEIPRTNFEVESLDVITDLIHERHADWSFAAEYIRDLILEALDGPYPVTVRATREQQDYILYKNERSGVPEYAPMN